MDRKLFGTIVIIMIIGVLGTFHGLYRAAVYAPSSTNNDHGDIWHSVENGEFKVEWRHVNNSQDTMAVIHIHQGDSLFTWVGKPCNCY